MCDVALPSILALVAAMTKHGSRGRTPGGLPLLKHIFNTIMVLVLKTKLLLCLFCGVFLLKKNHLTSRMTLTDDCSRPYFLFLPCSSENFNFHSATFRDYQHEFIQSVNNK